MTRTTALLTALVLNILGTPVSLSKELTSVEKLGLAGNVKSYTIYNAKETDEGLVNDFKTEEYHFDKNGNMTLHVVYTPHGHIIKREESDIDKKGKITNEKTLDKNGNASQKKENVYDKKGLLIKTITTDRSGQTVAVDSIIYDKKKRKTGKTRWQTNPPAKMTYTYNRQGDITERIIENDKNRLAESYVYNKQGDIAEWTKYETKKITPDSCKTDTTLTRWFYDVQHHLKWKEVSVGGFVRELYHYTCDIKGNKTNIYHYVLDDTTTMRYPIKAIECQISQVNWGDLDKLYRDKQKFTYDQNGNKTSESSFNYKTKTGSSIIYEITYY
ncbi:MAG: hypothetical protein MJZ23_02655 [Paludibacteraceae bacterium]|nr:hypothetical protein [Paludibacteraceae bacterium]